MHCKPGERARGTEDFAMNRFLVIAVYGSVLVNSLALSMTDYRKEEKTAVWTESLSDFDQNTEDGYFDKNRPESYTDDEDEERSSDPKWRKNRGRSNRRQAKQTEAKRTKSRPSGLRRRRRWG